MSLLNGISFRKHALAFQAAKDCDLETASLRVFGNADGAYGSNVNHLVENGRWEDEDELAETYTPSQEALRRRHQGDWVQQTALLKNALWPLSISPTRTLTRSNSASPPTIIIFDTLGGISRAVQMAKGGQSAPWSYIGDQTRGAGAVRHRPNKFRWKPVPGRLLPKWYEGMLKHGYEGVRQIEEHVTNTMGWSATTGEVAPWVYCEPPKHSCSILRCASDWRRSIRWRRPRSKSADRGA